MRTLSLATLLGALALAVTAPAAGAAVSPTATLAYVVIPANGSGNGAVWAAKADGSGKHLLAKNGYSPIVSPDGTQVLFTTTSSKGVSTLKVIPAAGGAARTLTTKLQGGAYAVWSPDGTKVLTTVGPEVGKASLVLIDVASATSRTIAKGYFSAASFSPDGTQFVYGTTAKAYNAGIQGDLWTATVAPGVPPVRITKDNRSVSPLWGPKAIVFGSVVPAKKSNDTPKVNLALIQPDGTGRKQLTTLKIPFLLFGLTPVAWSADGGALAAEYGGQDFSEGYAVSPVTGKARGLSTKKLEVDAYGISRDGSTILGATGGYDPGNVHNVVTTPYAGGPVKVLIKKASSPSWNG